MEELNTFNEVQEPAVEVPQTEIVDGETAAAEQQPQQEPAEPAQSREENQAFASMRKELEGEKTRNTQIFEAMAKIGIKGGSTDDIVTQIAAYGKGMSPEQYLQAQEQQNKAIEEQLLNSPQVVRMKQELEQYRQRQAQQFYDDDLKAIQAVDPQIKSIEQMGGQFVTLRANGVDTLTAYNAVKNARPKQIVPQMGDIGGTSETQPGLMLNSMGDEDFEALIAKVKRGEVKQI